MGYLVVKLIRATNLPSKTFGTLNPCVVMEIENCRSTSPVREDCHEPEWNLTYRYNFRFLYHANFFLESIVDIKFLLKFDHWFF